MPILLALYALFVIALTIAEYRQDSRAQYFFKPAAALGFLLLAVMSGALESQYGLLILCGLLACALGDVLLLSRKSAALFKSGMGTFALGHCLYIAAFIVFGLKLSSLWPQPLESYFITAAMVLVLNICKPISLIKKAPSDMKAAATIYAVIIVVMCILSIFTWAPMITAAALLFALSDHFVGRDRFVERKPWHAIAITPLYFGAQALFALSTALVL